VVATTLIGDEALDLATAQIVGRTFRPGQQPRALRQRNVAMVDVEEGSARLIIDMDAARYHGPG
jgi:hypothetical protein